jgi:branched-chain amino acid transport system substrate-binding protein
MPEPNGSVVKLGIIAPLSGEDQRSGENALTGVQTILNMNPYLSDGTKVELFIEDNKGTTEQTLSALNRIHNQEDVAGILLMAKSDIVMSILPLADYYKIPMLALIATHPDITKGNQFIAQLGFDDVFQATIAALYIRDEMLISKVAVFSDPGNVHYSFLSREFIRKFTSVGGEITRHITEDFELDDLRTILDQLRKDETQALYLVVSSYKVLQIAKVAKELNWKPKIMGSDGLLSSIYLHYREETSFVDGIMATDFYSSSLPSTEYGKRVTSKFKEFFPEPGTTYTALGAEGTSILLYAIERCDSKSDRTCVNTMLRHTDQFEGIFGKISIYENGKAERPIFVNVIDGQDLKLLVKVY